MKEGHLVTKMSRRKKQRETKMIDDKDLAEKTRSSMKTVGREIRNLIRAQGSTQREFCRSIGMNESDFSNFLHGRKPLGVRSLTRIAIGLGLSLQIKFVDPEQEVNNHSELTFKTLEDMILHFVPEHQKWS